MTRAFVFPGRGAQTIGMGKALAEAYRVLRPGGRFYCMEFSTSEWSGFQQVYDVYSDALLPRMGQVIAGDADSYRYLVNRSASFPKCQNLNA